MTNQEKISKEDSDKIMANQIPDNMDDWFQKKFDECSEKKESKRTKSMVILSSKGTMDGAYPTFILSTTAAALGWDVTILFTFYGMELLKKELDLKVSPLGNPAMPMKMPFGPDWLQKINMNIPNAVSSNVPWFENFATTMMEQTTKAKGVASIAELRDLVIEADVKIIACEMTRDLFNYSKSELIDEISDWLGATSVLPMAAEADVTYFL